MRWGRPHDSWFMRSLIELSGWRQVSFPLSHTQTEKSGVWSHCETLQDGGRAAGRGVLLPVTGLVLTHTHRHGSCFLKRWVETWSSWQSFNMILKVLACLADWWLHCGAGQFSLWPHLSLIPAWFNYWVHYHPKVLQLNLYNRSSFDSFLASF